MKNSSRYALINVLILLAIVAGFFVISLRDTSLFRSSLFEQHKDSYQPYFKEEFDAYDEFSEKLDSAPEDLSRWQNAGAITAWVTLADWSTISHIDLKLTDSTGKVAILHGIPNSPLPREENKIKSNDNFPDYIFDCTDQAVKSWEDYMLVDGKNLLFWEYTEPLGIDMSHVVSWEAFDASSTNTSLAATDVVIQDGLCKSKNSLNGAWYTPNGVPQYGVWWPEDGNLIMKKVSQTQYPSNGDHARILSSYKTPQNFLMRIKFTVKNLPESPWWDAIRGIEPTEELKNTYIRIGWDFDDVYDPGHDQTLIYDAFEYGYLGLQRVYPVERYFVQGYEPDQNNLDAKTKFSFKNNHTYEMDVEVKGESVTAEVYDIRPWYSVREAVLNYTFDTPRPVVQYPFSIESTGNVDIIIDSIEVTYQPQ